MVVIFPLATASTAFAAADAAAARLAPIFARFGRHRRLMLCTKQLVAHNIQMELETQLGRNVIQYVHRQAVAAFRSEHGECERVKRYNGIVELDMLMCVYKLEHIHTQQAYAQSIGIHFEYFCSFEAATPYESEQVT